MEVLRSAILSLIQFPGFRLPTEWIGVFGRFRNSARKGGMGMSDQEYWDRIGTDWIRFGHDRLWRRFTDEQQSRWARQFLSPDSLLGQGVRVLKTDLFDEAVSRGVVPLLASLFGEVHGIDLSPAIVAAAKVSNPGLIGKSCSIRQLPYPDQYFDAIFSGSTLDHFDEVAEIEASLREIHRVMKPNAKLFLTLDNPHHPIISLRNGALQSLFIRSGAIPYVMGKTLSKHQLVSMLERVGFRVERLESLQHCPRFVAVRVARLLQRFPSPIQSLFIAFLDGFEVVKQLPTRFRTGHYLAALAVRTSD
jgi:SAM-dependent methyltransferase